MKAFRKLILGAAAQRVLQAVVAVGVLTPVISNAADLPSAKDEPVPPMDHAAMAMPVIPATLTWVMTAPAGSFMFNYNPMFMHMDGDYIGSSAVSPSTIATSIPSGSTHTMTMGGMKVTMPTMWRIIPTSMDMQMQMFNGMYGVTDSLTIMASGSYVSKSMNMTSFSGMMGSTVLGQSSGTTDGLGDTMFGAEYKLYQDSVNRIVVGLMASAPTGSITRQVSMLSPMTRMNMIMRAPYGMQSGTGTWDLLPDVAYLGVLGPWSWGAAYRGRFALDTNADGWRFGDLHESTAGAPISGRPGSRRPAMSLRDPGPHPRRQLEHHGSVAHGGPPRLWRPAHHAARRLCRVRRAAWLCQCFPGGRSWSARLPASERAAAWSGLAGHAVGSSDVLMRSR